MLIHLFFSFSRKVKVSHTYSLPGEMCPERLYNALSPYYVILPFEACCYYYPILAIQVNTARLAVPAFQHSITKAFQNAFTHPRFAFSFSQ